MANIVPYINFAKNGQEAIKFYKGVFGGDAEVQFEGERVLHLDFQAGGIHFMGSDLQSDQAGLERGNGPVWCSIVTARNICEISTPS